MRPYVALSMASRRDSSNHHVSRRIKHGRSASDGSPPPGDRAEHDQQKRAERAHQREQQSEQTEREDYKRWEHQQAQAAREHWKGARAKHTARTRLPPIVRLSGAWVKWALRVVGLGFFWSCVLIWCVGALMGLLFFFWESRCRTCLVKFS